jgi:predicted DNA-binding ribbon-helix-helix protein
MSNLSLRLPDSLHRKLREIVEKDDVSINQFIATAAAEKAAAFLGATSNVAKRHSTALGR